ncbi:hypothetical protein EDB89DRAFT_2191378 [Lactarius sanguifluus]|nr:hypothetical protein EDB89DRAFT_2191378 [Lactarius sanguifluus]
MASGRGFHAAGWWWEGGTCMWRRDEGGLQADVYDAAAARQRGSVTQVVVWFAYLSMGVLHTPRPWLTIGLRYRHPGDCHVAKMNCTSLETHSPTASSADHPYTTPSSPPPLPSNMDPNLPPPSSGGPIRALCDDAVVGCASAQSPSRNKRDEGGGGVNAATAAGQGRPRPQQWQQLGRDDHDYDPKDHKYVDEATNNGDDCDRDHLEHDSSNEGRQLGDPDETILTTTTAAVVVATSRHPNPTTTTVVALDSTSGSGDGWWGGGDGDGRSGSGGGEGSSGRDGNNSWDGACGGGSGGGSSIRILLVQLYVSL